MVMYLFLLLVIAPSTMANSSVHFNGFQVYRVIPKTTEQLKALHQLEQDLNNFDFWTDVSIIDHPVDIMVPPNLKTQFKNFVELQQLNAAVMIEDVQERIDKERSSFGRTPKVFDWKDYQTLDKIYDWLESLPGKHPGIVSTIIGGETYEGRKILGVKICFKPGNKGIFLEGGIHAREWIAPATVTYIANQLLTSTSIRKIAESRDWYVFPSINPDGYVYTQINRMWRKNRKLYGRCTGADLNRNWGYHWKDGGASSNPCATVFAGSSAFSEIETKSLSEYISTIAHDLDIYLSFHSYGQKLLLPFGHRGHEKPDNNDEMLKIGEKAVKKLKKRYGTFYTVGNIPDIFYAASGGSTDWVLGTYRHIRLVYTFELRGTEEDGFMLPKEQIIPTGKETLDAVLSIVQQADSV